MNKNKFNIPYGLYSKVGFSFDKNQLNEYYTIKPKRNIIPDRGNMKEIPEKNNQISRNFFINKKNDKYKNILWDYIIKEKEYIIYYNINNKNEYDKFYYNEDTELYFKNKITQEQIDQIKALKKEIEIDSLKKNEKLNPIKNKLDYIDDKVYFDTNEKKFKLIFDKYINNYFKVADNRNIINPYKYDYYNNTEDTIKKYKNIFFCELLDTTLLVNYPDKFFYKSKKQIKNKTIICARCNISIVVPTLKRHMEQYHLKFDDFEKSFLSI
jgi:hypothetical protein